MSLSMRSKPKWWSSLLLLMVFCLSLIQPAAAAAATGPVSDPIALLREYNVVRGDERGDLQLGSPITRAQMAVILVRINGREGEVENLKGLGLFNDTTGHWADGYIASARIHGLMKGFEDGSYRPEEPVTYAQAFTLVLRLLGREPNAANWPTSALIDSMELKIVPPGFTGIAMLNQPAVRGEIFNSVGVALTTVKTPEGLTYFQKLIDSTPPELTIQGATTNEATFQLKGTIKGASRVLVNNEAVTLTGEAFAKTVSLTVGENRFAVEAYDGAGNKTSREVKVVRTSPAASLTITGPTKVPVGGTATFTVKAFDADNREVSTAGVQAKLTGNIGAFDVATSTLRAGQSAAVGQIEVSLGTAKATANVQVLGSSAQASQLLVSASDISYTKPMTVNVQVLDAAGVPVTEDYGRTVTLSATGMAGLTVTPAQAITSAGVATFTVRGTAVGVVTLTASSTGLTGDSEVASFMTANRIVLLTEQTRIPTDGSLFARVRAELRDDSNNPVTNKTGNDIYIDLSISGPGTLLQSRVRIANNASSSAQTQTDGMIAPTSDAGTITVTGTLPDNTLKYSVERLSISTYTPTVGSGTKFRVTPLMSNITVGSGNEAEFMVQLVDHFGSVIAASEYAFQVDMSTTNNEPKVNGLPEGMTVTLGDTVYSPVSDGKAGGDDYIARTKRGSALIKVSYDKPGTVTLKVVAASGTNSAYNTDGEPGDAASSSSAWVTTESAGDVAFRATPNTLKLTANSTLFGTDGLAINHRAGASGSYVLTAYIAYQDPSDADKRYWVPGQMKNLELYKNGTKVATAEARDGKATFSISASGIADTEDVYVVKDPAATGKLADSNSIYVRTDGRVPDAPGRPVTRGIPSLALDQVRADDTGMELDLPVDTTQRYVIVRVFSDTNTLVYTSGPIDVSGGSPTLVVPKASLQDGVRSYYVRYRNAYGESEKGVVSYPVTNFTVSRYVTISSAKYDAVEEVLYVYGDGFAADDVFAGEKLTVIDPSIKDPNPNDLDHPGVAYLSGAVVEYVARNQIKLHLGGVSDVSKLATFAGSVRLNAEVGWITKASGQMGGEDLSNSVGPMGYIESAAYDRTNRRLVIYGRGFKTGTLKRDAISVGTYALNATGMSVTIPYDTEIWVTLSTDAAAAVEGSASVQLSVADNWLTDGMATPVGKMAGLLSDLTVYGYVKATSVVYSVSGDKVTISGSGFAGGSVATGAVVKIVRGATEFTLINGAVTPDGKVTFEFSSTTDRDNFVNNFSSAPSYLVAETGWFEWTVGAGTRTAYEIPLSAGLKVGKTN